MNLEYLYAGIYANIFRGVFLVLIQFWEADMVLTVLSLSASSPSTLLSFSLLHTTASEGPLLSCCSVPTSPILAAPYRCQPPPCWMIHWLLHAHMPSVLSELIQP